MKAIIIARVSTEEQKKAGNSLPAQINRLKDYCDRRGFEIVKTVSFDESAYKKRRDDFDDILDFILGHKEKLAVCFDKVDRLSRNIFDKRVSVLYDKALIDEIELHFVSDQQVINSQLSAGEKFHFSISLGLAKYYSDAISDNTKRAQEQILRNGIYPTQPPYGYKRVPVSKGKTEIVVDEFASRIVQKVYEWYSTGSYSMDLLRKKLKEEYGIAWSHGYIDKVLKNNFYHGVMTWNKKMYPHSYLPIISKQLFDQVQQIKSGFNKKRGKFDGLPYIYRGLLRCEHCGLAITPEKQKGYVYYHCTQYNGKHGAEWLREENITEQIGVVFKGLQLPTEIHEQILETLKSTHDSKVEFRGQQFEKLTSEHEMYAKRIEKIYMDKLDGCITDDEYDRYSQSFREKLSEIDARLVLLQDAEDNYYVAAEYLLDLSKRAYDLFVSSELEQKRQLIKLVLQNPRIEGKTVKFEAQKPFDLLLDYNNHQLECRLGDSNP